MTWKRPNRLAVVGESEASESIAEVYTEIKAAVGVSQVPLLFQMYATTGPLLLHLWHTLKPVLSTVEVAEGSKKLRADAYTRMHSYFPIPDQSGSLRASQFSGPRTDELSRTIDFFHHEDAALLLLTTLIAECFDNPVGGRSARLKPALCQNINLSPTLAEDSDLSPGTRKILEEARRGFGLGVVPTEFRALAHWPDFLSGHWRMWKGITESALLAACEHQLMQHAIELTHGLPGPLELSSAVLEENGISEEEFAGIVRFTRNWNRALVTLLLEISAAKIAVEGGTGVSRFKEEEQPAEALPIRAA